MIVADTSPLNYLILIGAIDILPKLFQEIVIPDAVKQELLSVGALPKVRKWAENFPDWIEIRSVGPVEEDINLGKGEVEAISLAIEFSAEWVLLDDKAARAAAEERELPIIGTLGLIKIAHDEKLLDFISTVKELQSTNFRISQTIMSELLDRYES